MKIYVVYWKFDPEYPHEFCGIEDVMICNSRKEAEDKVVELGLLDNNGWWHYIKACNLDCLSEGADNKDGGKQ